MKLKYDQGHKIYLHVTDKWSNTRWFFKVSMISQSRCWNYISLESISFENCDPKAYMQEKVHYMKLKIDFN